MKTLGKVQKTQARPLATPQGGGQQLSLGQLLMLKGLHPLTKNGLMIGFIWPTPQEDGPDQTMRLPPPPFSNEFSYISYQQPPWFTDQQRIMTLLGGSETNLVFSDVMRKNILLDERFNYNFSFAYLYGSNDMPGYTAFVSNTNGDPKRYLEKICLIIIY